MTIERRIEKLEEKTGPSKKPYIFFVVYEGQPKPTEAQKEAAIAGYKAEHPDWETHFSMVLDMGHGGENNA